MMQQISNRVQALAPSQTLAMSQKSQELKAQGVDVINLSVGEPDFNTPDHIKEAAKKAIDDNFSFYSPVPGYMSLRKAISAKLKNENAIDFAPEQVVVSNGAKQSLCNVILAVINPGDEVIIPTPAWVSYVEMVNLAEGKSVLVPATIEQNFKITPEQLRAAITERTKLVFFNSPSNPTGSVYSKDELQALVNVLADYPDVLVLSDEIYEHINFTGRVHLACVVPRNRRQGMCGQRCLQGLCHDRLAYRIPRRTALACSRHQQAPEPVHFRSLFNRTEGCRGCIYGSAGMCRGDAQGI